MKLVILGGGAILVKNIKLSKGVTAATFMNQVEDGAAIFEKLRQRTGRINWATPLGRIEWIERRNRNNTISWFLERENA